MWRFTERFLNRYKVTVFVSLSFVISWAGEGLLRRLWFDNFLYLGSFGPALAAILLVLINERKNGIRALISKLFMWNVSFKWYLFALFLPLGAVIIAGTYMLIFNLAPILPGLDYWKFNDSQYLKLATSSIFFFIAMAIGEELGWRGYALPKLQAKYHPLLSSVIIGLWWGLWHMDKFIFGHGIRFSIFFLFVFIAGTIVSSIIFTWLYNNTKGSLLIAVLFHAMYNINVEYIFPKIAFLVSDISLVLIDLAAFASIAAVIIFLAGPRLSQEALLS